ncbi:MAG: DedA family protein [Candidatus Sumerlaeia bacterium]|nr:DedA family protein [Candidatus Sumerlaeia bacterium]
MLETLVTYVEAAVEIARVWGPLLIFLFMTIESSFIPFPSEVVMIPAGVMIARHEFPGGDAVGIGLSIAILAGLAGSMAGAYINYYLALWLGRPFLYRYAKYFFLKPAHLERAEALFREYGEITTFVCRLLPAIRQLISLPAGLARMNIFRFSLFTALGAGFWVSVLTFIGYGLGRASVGKSYRELIFEGKQIIHENLLWMILALTALVVVYVWIHKKIMGGTRSTPNAGSDESLRAGK